MPVIDLKIDKSLLHKTTHRVIAKDGCFVEVNDKGEELVTHHLQSMVLDSSKGVVFVVNPPTAAPAVPVAPMYAPTPEIIRYTKYNMQTVYKKLKQAANTGCGDVDARAILDLLKQAEVLNE